MSRKPDEISNIIKEQIKNYKTKIEMTETGTVILVGDGIASVFGLRNCMANEPIQRQVARQLAFRVCNRFTHGIICLDVAVYVHPTFQFQVVARIPPILPKQSDLVRHAQSANEQYRKQDLHEGGVPHFCKF